jgi:hypothetical protein
MSLPTDFPVLVNAIARREQYWDLAQRSQRDTNDKKTLRPLWTWCEISLPPAKRDRRGCEHAQPRRKINSVRKTSYGFGAPGMVFGRVAKWTISPTIGTSQPRTTTSVRFGDWRRAESFMIQIAIQSQMATEIRRGINITPQAAAKIPAAALSLSSIGVGLAVASSWARRAVAVKNSGRPAMSRFIRGFDYRFWPVRVNGII